MLDIKLICERPEEVQAALAKKGCQVDFTNLLEQVAKRKALMQQTDLLKAERNKVSAQIPALKKQGLPVEEIFAKMRALGDEIAANDKVLDALSQEITDFVAKLPNMPDPDLLAGEKENNQVVKVYNKKPEFDFKAKNHVDLCTALNLIDYERGVKLAGGGHWLYRGDGARLEWALLNFFIQEHLNDGYEFILPPHMLGYNCGFGAGQFPKFADEVFWVEDSEAEDRKKQKFMLPTAETALVNMYAGEIVDANKLPMKFFAYTPCYRKEAGSYRAEERGMIRGHQFNKIEMVQYTTPEQSPKAFEELVGKACSLMDKLGLHFRLSKLAAGDCSASMARTYDIEVWIPSMGIYKEVSSVSNANDYQARRNNTRYKDENKKIGFVHTLNGSGLATSRVFPALIEQYQNADGSVTIPEVLRPFMGGQTVIKL
ncbi:MAG: serine--tRNA ligase [Clostridia bacterium]|nr:serine--tRNA ligase [Clostridia bacterium]